MKGIKGKIMQPVYIMTGIFIICTLLQVWNTRELNKKVETMEKVKFAIMLQADELKLNIVQVQQWLSDISATRASEGYDDGFIKASEYADKVRETANKLKQLDNKNSSKIDDIVTSFEAYYETGVRMANAYIENGPEGGNSIMAEFDVLAEKINEKVDQYTEEAEKGITTIALKIQSSVSQSIISGGIISLLVLFLAALTWRKVTRQVVKPIGLIRNAAGELAKGNLRFNLTYASKDEMGELADGMRDTAKKLNGYISDIGSCMNQLEQGNLNVTLGANFQGDFVALRNSIINYMNTMKQTMFYINQAAKEVSKSSLEVSDVAKTLRDGSEEQDDSVKRLSESMEAMLKRIKEDAETTRQANHLIEKVGEETEKSMAQMRTMVGAMQQINESSVQIVNIIQSIEDIAAQTNMLSLNASIEAARAGEAGRGFAVVADQVGNLASESVQAAGSTTKLIDNSRRAVEKGSKIVDDTARALTEVEEGIRKVFEVIGKIAQTAERQESSIEEISGEVEQISEVVQTVSATAEESQKTSEGLLLQSEKLDKLVEQFQLD